MLAIFLFFITFFSGFSLSADETIHYQIKPIPTADRTNLEISVHFKAEKGKQINITLPTDYYGTPNLYRYVTSFEGQAGTLVTPGKEESERIVEGNENGEVSIKYSISYDPEKMNGTYSPNISAKHFHVAGCQWALQVGEFEEKHPISVEIINVPKDWQMYSSLGQNPLRFETNASLQDLIATAIGGGEKQKFQQFSYKGKPVTVSIEGKFDIPNQEIIAAVKKIVEVQRDWFNDFDQPFYNVTILPKEDNVAGTRIDNQFICFIKKDITRQQLYILLAHEMFHNWLGSELIKPEKDVTILRYAWFYEGVNDYFARKILLDTKLLSIKQFADLSNRDIINIADNPHKSTTFAELSEASKAGKYGQAFNKLSYYRGGLIALNWETQIRQTGNGKSLGDLIREVYVTVQKNGGISEDQFFEIAKKYGLDAKSDFERYILRGEPIKVEPDALGNSYSLKESIVPAFDPGFDLSESLKQKKVIGLKENSQAFQAGLRNGMEILGSENTNRFSTAWDTNKPMVVIVKDGSEKQEIKFSPHGAQNKLLLFQLD